MSDICGAKKSAHVCGRSADHLPSYHECGHPGCYQTWGIEHPTDAPPASAPRPEHVHTCTDPGPFIAQIAERDAEIARLREAGNRLAEKGWHEPECVPVPPYASACACGFEDAVHAWRALAGAAPKTETR